MLSRLIDWIIEKNIDNCLKIWCPNCGDDLIGNESFISDTYDENDDNHVLYKCTNCQEESDWNFDVAPCPVSWKILKGE